MHTPEANNVIGKSDSALSTSPPAPSLSQHDWSLHRKGPIDQARHNEKIKDAVRKNLPDIVAEQSILTTDGQKIIKVPIRSLEEYRFRYGDEGEQGVGQGQGGTQVGDVIQKGGNPQGPGKGQGAGEEPGIDYYEAEFTLDELTALIFEDLGLPNLEEKKLQTVSSPSIRFNDIRRVGTLPNLDKRQTLKQNLKRNARLGKTRVGDFKPEDLRFKTWEETFDRQAAAVVLAMMDVSGSMGSFEKYIARSFYYWMLAFLRTKYDNVEIVFIAHHTEAKEVTEEEFFTRGESGGTKVSSAYQLAIELTEMRYRPEDWNIYPFHFSDGDNWPSDNALCKELVSHLLDVSALFGYGEIRQGRYAYHSTLMSTFEQITHPKLMPLVIGAKADVYPALRRFFGPQTPATPALPAAALAS
jgi:sporulation protein YhbH